MRFYRLRPKAVEDPEAIGDFIAADDPARAVSFVDELLAVCARIVERPRAYQRLDESSPIVRYEL